MFSSGHDLAELTSSQGRDYHTQVFHTCAEVSLRKNEQKQGKVELEKAGSGAALSQLCLALQVMTLLQDIPVPVIAMVDGVATAAGCQLVASCDVAVATEKSTFATPGVNVGLFCSTPAVAIGRAVPRKVSAPSSRNLRKHRLKDANVRHQPSNAPS